MAALRSCSQVWGTNTWRSKFRGKGGDGVSKDVVQSNTGPSPSHLLDIHCGCFRDRLHCMFAMHASSAAESQTNNDKYLAYCRNVTPRFQSKVLLLPVEERQTKSLIPDQQWFLLSIASKSALQGTLAPLHLNFRKATIPHLFHNEMLAATQHLTSIAFRSSHLIKKYNLNDLDLNNHL